MYELRGEHRRRYFKVNGISYVSEYSWHYLDNGQKYHYIHCYTRTGRRPIKRWTWVTD